MDVDECRRAFELYIFGSDAMIERQGDDYASALVSNYWVVWRSAWTAREMVTIKRRKGQANN